VSASPTGTPDIRSLDDRLAAVKGVIFDVDGCLVLSDKPGGHGGYPLPDAVDALHAVRASGRKVVVFTNASSQVPAELADSLRSMGFELTENDVLTPAVVAAQVIVERFGDGPVLAFGGPGLVDVLLDQGVVVANRERPLDAVAVVIGWDVAFDRDRLQSAAEAVWNGAPLLVTSDARRFASATKPMAGLGGFIARGLSYVTETDYEVLGKPSAAAMAVASGRLGVDPAEVLVAGDDLTLEVAMARNAGGVGVLVTTGMHGLEQAAEVADHVAPDLVIHRLGELVSRLEEADRRSRVA
jgi:HAD superfamily hydrolase (TIGR01450 family)